MTNSSAAGVFTSEQRLPMLTPWSKTKLGEMMQMDGEKVRTLEKRIEEELVL